MPYLVRDRRNFRLPCRLGGETAAPAELDVLFYCRLKSGAKMDVREDTATLFEERSQVDAAVARTVAYLTSIGFTVTVDDYEIQTTSDFDVEIESIAARREKLRRVKKDKGKDGEE